MNNYLTTDFGNEGSHTHIYGTEAKKAVQDARDNIVDLVNASRNEIVLPVGQPKAITLQFGIKEYGIQNNKNISLPQL